MSLTVKQVAKRVGTKKTRIYKFLRDHAGAHELSYLAEFLGIPVGEVTQCVEVLIEEGKNVHLTNKGAEILHELPIVRSDVIDVSRFKGKHYRYGVTGDNHLGSKYSRLDVLNALFDIWEGQGVKTVLQLGNIIDGDCRLNKHDLVAHGIEEQTDYLIQNWPQRKGITTEFVTGHDHEGWWVKSEGINIGQHLQRAAEAAGREDLVYVGHMERQIEFKADGRKNILSMMHAGAGTPYAISYATQKIIESYSGGEKPTLLLVGHFHKFEMGYPREVVVVQPGATQDQTPFLRQKRIQSMIGGVTLDFNMDAHAMMHGFTVQWHPFYDRDFYKGKLWKYQWAKS
jgi:hypothetical protein